MECQVTNAHLKNMSEISYASHCFNCRLELNNYAGFFNIRVNLNLKSIWKGRGGSG